MKTVASHALGCKVNQYESEAISELFSQRGYDIVDIDEKADIYIINTCTVTNFGDKKSRQLIRKVKRQNPNSIIAVVGCYAQTAPNEIMKIDGVNIVIGTKNRHNIVNIVENYNKEDGTVNYVSEIMKERQFEYLSINELKNRTRAYLKIQDGCSQFCSYCIIPYARGPIRSRKKDDIIKEVKILSNNGFKEIVLTGIHVASYGKDLKNTDLKDIIKSVNDIDGIERIRLSSIEPNIITENFVEELSLMPKVCRHFHLSLQSGCEKTLKNMNRHYTPDKYYNSVCTIRKYMPDAAITTDMIVGFPGESDEDFEESYNFAQKVGFAKIHVFQFSPKKGTPAAKMENQIENNIKSERSKKLIKLSDNMALNFMNKFLNTDAEVLFEKNIGNNLYEGHMSNYIKVIAKSDKDIENLILNVRIKNIENNFVKADII